MKAKFHASEEKREQRMSETESFGEKDSSMLLLSVQEFSILVTNNAVPIVVANLMLMLME